MTTAKYFIARVALAFGISRKQRRRAEAASETHLLREAEQLLGERIWERVESVEELGIEYWNLRRLHVKRDELKEKLHEAEDLLTQAHEQRAELLGAKSEKTEDLEEERSRILAELDQLARKRDDIVRRARDIRRLYDGIKTKLEVLRAEKRDDPATEETSRKRMAELRGQFDALKAERTEIAGEIARQNAKIDKLDTKLDEERTRHRADAAEAFQMIGEANQKISSFKAEIGLMETEMQQLYGEIGRHVSRTIKTNPVCRDATRDWSSMVDVMEALRRSIQLNHRLSGG
jgi:chromosome segregation ATPase